MSQPHDSSTTNREPGPQAFPGRSASCGTNAGASFSREAIPTIAGISRVIVRTVRSAMREGWGLGTGVPLPMGHGSEARVFGAATIGSGVEHQEATQAEACATFLMRDTTLKIRERGG